jgi:tetratricopeptide (TPR) repeat protein
MTARAACVLVALSLLAGGGARAAAPGAGGEGLAAGGVEPTLDDCDRLTREQPRDLAAYDCYQNIARRRRVWDDAARRLDARLAAEPDNHWARFELALIEWDRRAPRAAELTRAAADGFAAAGDARSEARARISVSLSLRGQDERAADRELQRAEDLARAIPDQPLLGYVLVQRGWSASAREDYGAAFAAFKNAEAIAFPDGPRSLQGYVLSGLGSVAFETGREAAALEAFERQADLYRRLGQHFDEVQARSNVVMVRAGHGFPEGAERERLLEALAAAVDAARRAGNLRAESHLLAIRAGKRPGPEAIEDLRRAVALARSDPDRTGLSGKLRLLASALERDTPDAPADEARRLREEALAIDRRAGSHADLAAAWFWIGRDRARAGDEAGAREAFDACLDEAERVRDLQPEAETRLGAFAHLVPFFEAQSGAALAHFAERGDPADLERGFRIQERARARILLESLEAAGAPSASRAAVGGRERDERDALLARLADVQRRLRDPALPDRERPALLGTLEELEAREAILRDAVARADPEFAALRRPDFPSIEAVRQALHEDEALIAFEIADRPDPRELLRAEHDGGSWALVLTRDGAAAVPVPDRAAAERATSLLSGAIARRDGGEERLAAEIGRDFLGAAWGRLGPGVRRLVIVPDGPLHRMPFEVLRPDRGGAPLGATHEIARAPSATVWWRFRREATAQVPTGGLILADPDLGGADREALRLAAPWYDGLRLGRLPYARREGEEAARRLGRSGTLLAGDRATERALKSTPPDRYSLLHIAAHAVVDERRPERSAIVLAPGDPSEDGLVQPREIAALPLHGQVVLLSACESASGSTLRGEGLVGLAPAFFRAGARTVLGGLFTLRDEEASDFVGAIVAGLARGERIGAATFHARRDLIRRGAPAAAWGAVIVLGDGDRAPLPGGGANGDRPRARWVAAAAGALIVLVLLAGWARRMRPERGAA